MDRHERAKPPVGLAPRWRRRIALAILLSALLVAALVLGLGRWWQPAQRTQDSVSDAGDALAKALDRALERDRDAGAGVALRPLAAPAMPAELAGLADAACAAVAERLARLPALRVVPCRSTSGAVVSDLDDRRLARLLAVRYVLRGELAPQNGDRLRVRLRLHEPDATRDAWQLDDELSIGDLQRLPVRVSAAIGGALGLRHESPAPPSIPDALYSRFVRARELGARPSLDARREAVKLLDEVLEQAPDHVPSLLLRHSLRGFLLGNEGDGRRSVAELNAEQAAHAAQDLVLAERVLTLDPLNVRGQTLLLGHEIETRQWAEGLRRMDAMLQRDARQPGVLRLAARLHLHAGYVARAGQLALLAARHNALDAEAMEILAMVAGIQGPDAEMRELWTTVQQVGHEGLGRIEVFDAWRRRDWAALERSHSAWVGWGGQWSADWVPAWARGLADPAQRDAAARLLDGHDAATRQHFVSYFVEYALLGDVARSLSAVQHHAKLPPATWMQELWWPEFAEVGRQPAFAAAMADLGFVALWEARGDPDLGTRSAQGWTCR